MSRDFEKARVLEDAVVRRLKESEVFLDRNKLFPFRTLGVAANSASSFFLSSKQSRSNQFEQFEILSTQLFRVSSEPAETNMSNHVSK